MKQATELGNSVLKVLAAAIATSGAISMSNAMAQAAPATPAPTPEHTLATKVSVYSEYEYRGITQTSEKPALQLNIDYSHSSGLYLGTFLTNINWLKDTGRAGGVKDVTMDLGYLRYEYPSNSGFNPKPNTDEFYIGVAGGPVSAKYSYATSTLFGVPNSKGSTFFELNWAQEVMPKLTLNAQVARQTVKKNDPLAYTVYKAGATYDIGDGWNAGGYYKTTNAVSANYTYLGKDWSKGRLVAFVSKSF
jgi:uncharacterized protein (TIGR02001 family)